MDRSLYYAARALLALMKATPLRCVALLGALGGEMAYWLDAGHRRVAHTNLRLCFGDDCSPSQIRQWARINFRRIGENYACALKTSLLSPAKLSRHFSIEGEQHLAPLLSPNGPRKAVFAVGHFGNFELYTHLNRCLPGFTRLATYRALGQPRLNRLFLELRSQSGCLFFERRREAAALRARFAASGPAVLGLLADQNAGRKGLPVPFFGRECLASPAPAIFAMRYHCPLFTAICYRTALAQWRIEIGPEIPTHQNGERRSTAEITADIQACFEKAVRRDPPNWFWVHQRWKPRRPPRPHR